MSTATRSGTGWPNREPDGPLSTLHLRRVGRREGTHGEGATVGAGVLRVLRGPPTLVPADRLRHARGLVRRRGRDAADLRGALRSVAADLARQGRRLQP